jgi:PTS system ascorbate-specific IIA component
MVGILLIAHRPLASAFALGVAHVYCAAAPARAAQGLRALDVAPDADVVEMVAAARALAAEIDDGAGVLVLTDVFGATPGNVASELALSGRIAVLAGLNLPMLLRAVCYRDNPLPALVEKALAGALHGVLQVGNSSIPNQDCRPAGNDHPRLHNQQ